MYSRILKVLVFFRICDDHDNSLSITNLAMFVVLYKLATVTTTSVNDLGTLLVALSGYNLKKFINADMVKSLQSNKIVQKAEEIISSQQ